MVSITKKIKKSIKVGGVKKTREGSYSLNLASAKTLDSSTTRTKVTEFDEDEALHNALALVDGSGLELAKWFDYGRLSHARITFSNMLAGANRDLNSLIKQFEENAKAITEYTGENIENVRAALLEKKESFAPVAAYFDSFSGNGLVEFDESQLEDPKWFSGEEDDDDDDETPPGS